MPLFSRDLIIVSDECIKDNGADWPKLTWILDARNEKNLYLLALPLPPVEEFGLKGGRLALITFMKTRTIFKSEEILIGAFFNAGIRIYDIKNPYQPNYLFCPQNLPTLGKCNSNERCICR